ncbi:glycogen debranching protein GlgX, partial [candidate division CSSED10-310 bacterium]
MDVKVGSPFPLGATWDGQGVNFAVYSQEASAVELCLFDTVEARVETDRIPLIGLTDSVWHVYLSSCKPGQLYGYRVQGEYQPQHGLRFNPHKVLLDPYARAIGRDLHWHDSLFGYRFDDPEQDLSCDERDDAEVAPLAAVIDPTFRWRQDQAPRTPWHKTLIYETHVRGLTMKHPGVPEELRGTYLGLTSKVVLNHLRQLGVTAVELMPIHHPVNERNLVERGLVNYWGYNTLSYFAPNSHYAHTKEPVGIIREFKEMVRRLHQAGLEVILDVVYNHTGEGSHLGPTLSFRGLDNTSYYRLMPDKQRYYQDFTGCGNTLNTQSWPVVRLIMDSLRYWVVEMHVDGFRFDLASVFAREQDGLDFRGSFFSIINQDPVLSQVKLIAEPWDARPDGYQIGKFPPPWREWNGKFRDGIRQFWRGNSHTLGEFASRLSGSNDLYGHHGRDPTASINFVTSHDGFSLHDLVSYNQKHNENNGENNRDGENHNLSWNCGVEGQTDDPHIGALRQRLMRNFIATLFLSQGVPMIRSGDEMAHSQRGNNNSYCQNNEINWLNWILTPEQQNCLLFLQYVSNLRQRHPVLRRRFFFGDGNEVRWLNPAGKNMSESDWYNDHCVGLLLNGHSLPDLDEPGKPSRTDTILILINGSAVEKKFSLPP